MRQLISKVSDKFPLRTVIVLPFLIQISTVVGLTGWLSFRNGQKAVNNVATELRSEITARIRERLRAYIETPHLVNQLTNNAISLNQLNIKNLPNTERYFWKHIQSFPSIGDTYIATPTGEFFGARRLLDGKLWLEQAKVTYAADSQGNRQQVVQVSPDYDPRTRPWYTAAVKARKPTWSAVYPDYQSKVLAITASQPLYDKSGSLIGILASDLFFSQFNEFLRNLKIGKSGKIFIIERSGMLVSTSTTDPVVLTKGDNTERIPATASQNQLIQLTAKYLKERFGNLAKIYNTQQLNFSINGDKQFIQVTPLRDKRGLDLLIVVIVPESDFMEQINANNRTTILLCIASLGLVILFGLETSKWIVQPILQLNAATKRLSEGEWDQNLPVERCDEIGQLAQSFNSMREQLKESFETLEQKVEDRTAELVKSNAELEQRNALIRQVFGRYLTNEVVATLLEHPEGLKLGGERRTITILTSDLRGFTSQSERLHPEEVVEILNFYLHHMADIITKYQGTIDEFMGDGILVLFGAPTAREDDVERAVACAVEMQLAMVHINEKLAEQGLPLLEMGIGINTGEVVVGNIGSEKRTKYGVVGSHVNLAYRIESYTVGGQILISEQTLKEVSSIVKINGQKQVTPKGIKQPVTIYEVAGISGQYNLFLSPQSEEELFTITETIPIQYRILNGKQIDETPFRGTVVKISAKAAEIRCDSKTEHALLSPMTNIKLELLNFPNPGEISDEIYAKVLEKPVEDGCFYVYFTSVPTTVKLRFEELYHVRLHQ